MNNELLQIHLGPIMPVVLDKNFNRTEKETHIKRVMQQYAEAYHAERLTEVGEPCTEPFHNTKSLIYSGCTPRGAVIMAIQQYKEKKCSYVDLLNAIDYYSSQNVYTAVNEKCFSFHDIKDKMPHPYANTVNAVGWLNTRANEYRLDGMKRALAKAENAEQEFGEWGSIHIKKSSITDPKNLEV